MSYWLETSERKQYDAWVVAEKDWIIPLLVELYAMGDMKNYIKKLFIKIGLFAELHLTSLMKHKKLTISIAAKQLLNFIPKPSPPSIRADFFKQFIVFVGERMVKEKEWKSKKAKTILKYLLCMRNKGYIDKEVLMELLWPDEDPRKSAQRFHVALASLRKTLEPELAKGVRSSYISRSGHAYWIDIGEEGIIDSEEFVKELSKAKSERDPQKALNYFMNSESIYKGDFLEEDLYEDWCSDEREKYKENYLFALTKIIEYYDTGENYEGCITAANNYLKIDKYDEEIIRLLMNCYSLTGNKAMAIKIYEKSKNNIKKELCCHLSDETEALYKELVSV
jgi:LuxR family maltose regulon positive regulatory protein